MYWVKVQPGYKQLNEMEKVLLKACNEEGFSDDLHLVCEFLQSDIDTNLLRVSSAIVSLNIIF